MPPLYLQEISILILLNCLINKYFGEIKSHGEVATRTAMIPALDKTVKLYHEDNFANVPEINNGLACSTAISERCLCT